MDFESFLLQQGRMRRAELDQQIPDNLNIHHAFRDRVVPRCEDDVEVRGSMSSKANDGRCNFGVSKGCARATLKFHASGKNVF